METKLTLKRKQVSAIYCSFLRSKHLLLFLEKYHLHWKVILKRCYFVTNVKVNYLTITYLHQNPKSKRRSNVEVGYCRLRKSRR